MVKQTENKITREIDKLNENESLAVLDYISGILSARASKSKENPLNDDLIVSLSDARENKRARQVVEWERIRRKSPYRAA
jgi:hypothetical protein